MGVLDFDATVPSEYPKVYQVPSAGLNGGIFSESGAHYRPKPYRPQVRLAAMNANDWSSRMQLGGQVECKQVVK